MMMFGGSPISVAVPPMFDAGEEEDDVEIDECERLALVDDPEQDHQRSANQGRERAVDLLGHYERVDPEEDQAGDDFRAHDGWGAAEVTMRRKYR